MADERHRIALERVLEILDRRPRAKVAWVVASDKKTARAARELRDARPGAWTVVDADRGYLHGEDLRDGGVVALYPGRPLLGWIFDAVVQECVIPTRSYDRRGSEYEIYWLGHLRGCKLRRSTEGGTSEWWTIEDET